jgi:hypothetical protein
MASSHKRLTVFEVHNWSALEDKKMEDYPKSAHPSFRQMGYRELKCQ